MDRNFTKRAKQSVFRYGSGEKDDNSYPVFGEGKSQSFDLPLPKNPVLGTGRSRAITAKDGCDDYPWNRPKSGIEKP